MVATERHDKLLRLLRQRADWRAADLARELGVSTRTIMRDLERLRDRGFEITSMSGPGGGVHLEPSSVLVTSQLDGEEVVALILSVAMSNALPWMPFAGAGDDALAKIEASLPYERSQRLQALMMRIMVGDPAPASVRRDGRVRHDLARLFEAAFRDERLLAFSYTDRAGARTQRVVEPHGLLVRAPIWYVIAWDVDKKEARLFRADRISRPRVLDTTFVPRPHELVTGLCPDASPVRSSR